MRICIVLLLGIVLQSCGSVNSGYYECAPGGYCQQLYELACECCDPSVVDECQNVIREQCLLGAETIYTERECQDLHGFLLFKGAAKCLELNQAYVDQLCPALTDTDVVTGDTDVTDTEEDSADTDTDLDDTVADAFTEDLVSEQ